MAYLPVLSNVSFALPLVILVAAGILWWWTTRVSVPPRLAAVSPLRSWKVSPVAAVYASLRQDQYLLAAYLLKARLARLAFDQVGIAPDDLRTWMITKTAPALPIPLTPGKVWSHLTSAYGSAYLAEGAPVWESFSDIIVPRRRRKAAREFARAAAEVEEVVAAWSGAT
ncbi:MAG: hypothetical protein L3J92_04505 [Thermoplasmata archaeon]|nr:hypothetical protein [Thermoplasmata archaeon]